MIKNDKLQAKQFNLSILGRKRTWRIFNSKYDLSKFNSFDIKCQTVKFDGSKLDNRIDKLILYVLRYEFEKATMNQLLKYLNIKDLPKNKKKLSTVLDLMFQRKLLLVEIIRKVSFYSINSELIEK